MGLQAKRRVLLIGGEGVVLYMPTKKGIEREISIAWSVPNFDEQLIEALAAQYAAVPVAVIFDGADQAYRKEENIPKLSPFDRPRFVRRKLELAFPSYPIRAALELKATRPKGLQVSVKKSAVPEAPPSYLFAALPEVDNLDRVGKALFESGVPVMGFGLLPVESSGLVVQIADKLFGDVNVRKRRSRWAVLIGQHETGGIRQLVVKDGRMSLTRLTPPPEAGASGPVWAEEVGRVFKETLAYVSRLGYTPDDGLDVAVVCGDIEKQFFSPTTLPATNFKCINLGEALSFIGVKAFGLEKGVFADALHAAWIGRKASLELPVRVPSIHRVMAPRLYARLGAGLLVLTALVLAYLTVSDYQSYFSSKEEVAQKENQRVMMQREYDEETKAFEALPVKPENLKNALAVKDMLNTYSVDPSPVLNQLKDALGGDIMLDELEYKYSPPEAYVKSEAPAPGEDGKVDRGLITVSFSFTLPPGLQPEQKVLRTEALEKMLKAAFPGWTVAPESAFANASRNGIFEGIARAKSKEAEEAKEEPQTETTGAEEKKDDMIKFNMEGPPL